MGHLQRETYAAELQLLVVGEVEQEVVKQLVRRLRHESLFRAVFVHVHFCGIHGQRVCGVCILNTLSAVATAYGHVRHGESGSCHYSKQ